MTSKPGPYSYRSSVKSNRSDELINTVLIRPIAGLVVRVLFRTPVTPNQVTLLSTIAGIAGALLYLGNDASSAFAAGLCVSAKDILDSADGQLARAKQQFSRTGRFLDSIGDFVVNLSLFSALAVVLASRHGTPAYVAAGVLGFLGVSLRVSYHVFYQTAFLHLEEKYTVNRLSEEIRPEDRRGDPQTLRLQMIFTLLYGWQDRMMARLDRWAARGDSLSKEGHTRWYADRTALRLSGFLGLGTELFLLTLCSLMDALELYLALSVGVWNGLWLVCLGYRRWILWGSLRRQGLTTSPPSGAL